MAKGKREEQALRREWLEAVIHPEENPRRYGEKGWSSVHFSALYKPHSRISKYGMLSLSLVFVALVVRRGGCGMT